MVARLLFEANLVEYLCVWETGWKYWSKHLGIVCILKLNTNFNPSSLKVLFLRGEWTIFAILCGRLFGRSLIRLVAAGKGIITFNKGLRTFRIVMNYFRVCSGFIKQIDWNETLPAGNTAHDPCTKIGGIRRGCIQIT